MSNIPLNRVAAVISAAAAAATSWAVTTQVAGVNLGVQFPHSAPSTIGLGRTVGAAVAASAVGWAVLAVSERRLDRPRLSWVTAAGLGAAASLILPVGFATTTSAMVGLIAIHIAVAVVAITAFAFTTPASRFPSSTGDEAVTAARPRHRLTLRVAVISVVAIAVTAGAATAAAAAPMWRHARTTSSPVAPGWGPGGWGHPGTGFMNHPGAAADTEYFHVVSTDSTGPGSIIVTGVINAGGTENPGRAVDGATFAGGAFRIDHSSGKPTLHFDAATCVGTITQSGPFQVIDATGDMSGLAGSGHYVFRALYTTARAGGHCSSRTTAYTETIDGMATVKG